MLRVLYCNSHRWENEEKKKRYEKCTVHGTWILRLIEMGTKMSYTTARWIKHVTEVKRTILFCFLDSCSLINPYTKPFYEIYHVISKSSTKKCHSNNHVQFLNFNLSWLDVQTNMDWGPRLEAFFMLVSSFHRQLEFFL